jgi:uncharacterized repeat protein (TIGR01451 family)
MLYVLEIFGIQSGLLDFFEYVSSLPKVWYHQLHPQKTPVTFTRQEQTKRKESRNKGITVISIILVVSMIASVFTYNFNRYQSERAQAASQPIVTANIPGEVNIGEDFIMNFTFNNIGSSEGYAPYIDIIIPTIGADGAGLANEDDGITTGTATYFGVSITTNNYVFPEIDTTLACGIGETGVLHPYAVDTNNDPVVVCGIPGNTLKVIDLPFGSFVDTQPAATIAIPASLSDKADLGTPLEIEYRGGFRFGDDPLDNATIDPTIIGAFGSSSVTPTVFTQSKTAAMPEGETATGPNYPRSFTINANIADGQTVTNLELADLLPNNIVYLGVSNISPSSGVISTEPPLNVTSNAPNNELIVNFASVTGTNSTSDASITIDFYVPQKDADGDDIINQDSGNDVVIANDSRAQGDWIPIDTRDNPSTVTSDVTTVDAQFTAKSIATQKSVTNLTNSNQNRPGDLLEYTINFQISDYFSFNQLVVNDVMSDGQIFDTSFAPTLSVTENSANTSGAFNSANFVSVKDTGYSGATGNTFVEFNISDELVIRSLNDSLVGGCTSSLSIDSCDTNLGPTTGTIIFRATLADQYTDDFSPGDPSINMGDFISNDITITGDVLDNTTLISTGESETDGSGTFIEISEGDLEKTIYAINGVMGPFTNPEISPGDVITYRLEYFLELSDIENFFLEDFLPLPSLSADNFSTTFDPTISAAVPPAGSAKFGPNETFFGLSGLTPTVSFNSIQNTVRFDYGSFEDFSNQSTTVDILLSIQVNDEPFADNLKIVNQVQGNATNTFNEVQVSDAIVPVTLRMPSLNLTKGIVATDNPNGTFDPDPVSPVPFSAPGTIACSPGNTRFTGNISTSNLSSTPIDSNLSDVDALDLVTYAMIIENTGEANKGAFNIQVNDALPAGMQIPSGGANICITRGDGTVLNYTPNNPADTNPLFENGIEIDDIGPLEGSIGRLNSSDTTTGENIIVITYDAQLESNIDPFVELENTANLLYYTASEFGSTNFVPQAGIFDTAIVTSNEPDISKQLTDTGFAGTTDNDVVIGETISYTLDIVIPEGTTDSLVVRDQLDNGLAFIETTDITANPILTTDITGSFASIQANPTVTNSGRNIEWDFGNVINTNTDNSSPEIIQIEYDVVVVNNSANNNGNNKNNSADLEYNNTSTQNTPTVNADNVTIREPDLTVTKTGSSNSGDAGNNVTYTIAIEHSGSSTADAYEIELEDIIDPSFDYVPGSFSHDSGLAPDIIDDTGGTLSAGWDTFAQGQTSTFSYQVTIPLDVFPNQDIPNTASIQWTSLPGAVSTPISTFNNQSVERTGDPNDIGGSVNDYNDSDTTNYAVNNVVLTKTIDATSEADTGFISGHERVAVGEIIRYRTVSRIPEGTILGARLRDRLPTRLQFINDGTATLGFSSNGGLTSDDPAFGACNQVGSDDSIEPACAIPTNNITGGPFNPGTDPFFELGTIVNADSDGNNEYIVLEFNALVLNRSDNQGINQSNGNSQNSNINNTYSLVRDNQGGGSTNIRTSGGTSANRARVSEPYITVDKVVSQPAIDAGDELRYEITFTNTNNITNGTPAYDLNLTDVVDSNLDLTQVNVISKPAATTITDNSNIGANVVDLDFDVLGLGESVTVEIVTDFETSVSAGAVIPNTAFVTYTSLPGNGTASNPTGSTTPFTSDLTSERNGTFSSSVNNFSGNDSVDTVVSIGNIDKENVAGSSFRIGEEAEFDILVTLPEGFSQNVRVRDLLPAGLIYQSYQVFDTAAGSPLLTSDFSGSLPTPTVTTGPLELNFGDQTLVSDNDVTNNSFVIRVTTQVADIVSNQNGTVLTNNSDLVTTNVATNNDQITSDPTPPTVTVQTPILNVTKTFTPDQTAPNQNVTITIELENTGPVAAYEVDVQDVIDTTKFDNILVDSVPAGYTDSTTSGAGTLTVDFAGGTINSGTTQTFIITADLLGSLTAGEVITNDADVLTASTMPGTVTGERILPPITAQDDLTVITPDIRVEKTDGITVSAPGDQLIYTITVSNDGDFLAENILVTDTLPANTSFNATNSLPTVWTDAGGGDYTITIPSLTPGQSQVLTFATDIDNPVPGGVDEISNTVTANDDGTNGGDPTPGNNTATDTNTLNAAPDIAVTKTDGVTLVETGDLLTYTIDVSNIGNQTATGVVVTETVPAHTTYVDTGSSAWSCPNGSTGGTTCLFTIPSLTASSTSNLVFRVQVDTSIPTGVNSIINTVIAADDGNNGTDPTPANNTATDTDTLNAAPDLTVTKTNGITTTTPGSINAYTITITNNGDQTATGVLVTDTLDGETSYVSSSDAGSEVSGVVTWPTFTLAPGASVNRTVTIQVNPLISAGVENIVNTVVVADDGNNGPDENPSDNTDTDTDTLTAAPDLEISKSDSLTATGTGQQLSYIISYTNSGNQAATNVVITETVPNNATYVATGSSAWSCADGAIAGTNCTLNLGTLAAGDSGNATFNVLVDSSVPTGVTSITNTVTITDDGANGADPTPGNNTSTDIDTLNAVPDLALTKTDGETTVVPGDTLSYTIAYTNNGDQTASGVIITETVPANTTYVATGSSAWSCVDGAIAGTVCTITIGEVASGSAGNAVFRVEVDPSVGTGVTSITNTASVADDGTNGSDPTPGDNEDTDVDVLNAAPDLAVTIDDGGASTTTGGNVVYTVDYSNVGVQNATGAELSITVPANTTFDDTNSDAGWSCSDGDLAGTICSLTIGNLNVGDSGSVDFAVDVNSSLPAGVDELSVDTTINDDGTNGPDQNPVDNINNDTTPVTAAPDMSITIDDSLTTVIPGQGIAYVITITNIGDQDATGVEATTTLDSLQSFVSASDGGTETGGVVTWNIGPVAVGEVITRTVIVDITNNIPSGISDVTATATVADDGTNGADPTPANNSDDDIDTLDAVPDLYVTKMDGGASATPDTNITYTITYGNNGNQGATGVVLTETVPDDTVYVAAGSSGWSCTDGAAAGTICTLSVGALATGASGVATFVVNVDNPLPGGVDEINNTISIADDGTNGPDENPSDNSYDEVTTASAFPDYTITKTDNGVSVEPGGTITYTLNYNNTGNQDGTGVVITETVPEDTVYVASGSSPWSCSDGAIAGSVCTLTIGALSANNSGTATFIVQVNDSVASGVTSTTNTTSITDDGNNGADPTPGNNSDSEDTPINAAADLTVVKTGPASIDNLNSFTYTIDVTNNGDQDATGVVISDTIPNFLTIDTISDGGSAVGNLITWPSVSLAVGDSVQRTIDVTFNAGSFIPAGLESITNVAQASDDGTNGPDKNPSDNSDTAITTVNGAIDLTLTIDDGITETNVGDTNTYTIEVNNVGDQQASGVVITVPIPTEGTPDLPASDLGWVCTVSECTYSVGTVDPGTTVSIDLGIEIVSPANTDTITVPASVADDGTSGADPTPANNSDDDTDEINGNPDLAITKTNGVDSVAPDQNVTYTVNVVNNGNIILTGITVVDTYDTLFSYVSSDNGGVNDGGNNSVTWSGITLLPGEDIDLEVVLQVASGIPSGINTISNSVTVSDDDEHGPEETPEDNENEDEDDIDAQPDLQVLIDIVPTLIYPQEDVLIEFDYENVGNQDATGVFLDFDIPALLAEESTIPDLLTLQNIVIQPGWDCETGESGANCIFFIGDLDIGDSGSTFINLRLVNGVPAGSTIEAEVIIADDGLNGAEITLANNDDQDIALVPSVNMELSKTADVSQAQINDIITYDITYRNLGIDTATQVLVDDVMPNDLEFVSATLNGQPITPSVTVFSPSQTLLRFSVPDIPVGGEQTILVTTRLVNASSDSISNQAIVRTRESDPEVSNNNNNSNIQITGGSGPAQLLRTGSQVLWSNPLWRLGFILLVISLMYMYAESHVTKRRDRNKVLARKQIESPYSS